MDILGKLLVSPQASHQNFHLNHSISQSGMFLDEVGVASDERIHTFRSCGAGLTTARLETIFSAELCVGLLVAKALKRR